VNSHHSDMQKIAV